MIETSCNYMTYGCIGSQKFQIPIPDPSSATVGLLKQLLHEKTGIAQEAQKLIFKGVLMLRSMAIL